MMRRSVRPPRGTGIIVPPALRPGDLVGVVAPGFAVDRRGVEAGIRVLERLGLRVKRGRSLFAREGYLAGPDRARLRDLVEMIEDEDVRAIHFARGGWGSSRLIGNIPWASLRKRPKIMIGYSDLTSVFAAAVDRCRLSCIYGPLLTEMGDPSKFDRASFLRACFDPRRPIELQVRHRDVLAPGRASGLAAGGCLTLLAHLAGTPYAPNLAGRILLIEEVGEAPYRIDRMLVQMKLSGMLEGVAGVIVGALSGCRHLPGSSPSPDARSVIASCFEPLGIPVVAGIRFGHARKKLSVPLGFRVTIDSSRGRVIFTP